jgi:hypothetical protein
VAGSLSHPWNSPGCNLRPEKAGLFLYLLRGAVELSLIFVAFFTVVARVASFDACFFVADVAAALDLVGRIIQVHARPQNAARSSEDFLFTGIAQRL